MLWRLMGNRLRVCWEPNSKGCLPAPHRAPPAPRRAAPQDVGRFRILGASMQQMPGWCSDLKYAGARAAAAAAAVLRALWFHVRRRHARAGGVGGALPGSAEAPRAGRATRGSSWNTRPTRALRGHRLPPLPRPRSRARHERVARVAAERGAHRGAAARAGGAPRVGRGQHSRGCAQRRQPPRGAGGSRPARQTQRAFVGQAPLHAQGLRAARDRPPQLRLHAPPPSGLPPRHPPPLYSLITTSPAPPPPTPPPCRQARSSTWATCTRR